MGQTISSTQFFLYGKRHFTQTGYLKHVKSYVDPVQSSAAIGTTTNNNNTNNNQSNDENGKTNDDGVDLTGKVIVVTGANSGLGKEIATYAAAKHAKVYLLCRNADRAAAAAQEIQHVSRCAEPPSILLVDVAELLQVRNAARELQQKESTIHALVCNAGVLLNEKSLTQEGNEVTFASHVLGGSYLLTQLLLPQLRRGSPHHTSRVIMVTSGGMYNFKLPRWDVLTSTSACDNEYNGVNVYAYAKRGQVILAEQWAAEQEQQQPQSPQQNPVTFVTAHPGWADTPAVDDAFGDMKKYLQPLRSPWQGAEGIAWLLSADASKLQNGGLYLDRMPQPKHLAGPFFTEGSYTKNKPQEVQEFMQKLKEAAGL